MSTSEKQPHIVLSTKAKEAMNSAKAKLSAAAEKPNDGDGDEEDVPLPPPQNVAQPPASPLMSTKAILAPGVASSRKASKISEDGMITVRPVRTEKIVFVSGVIYSFIAGKNVQVPVSVVPHLTRCGILNPPSYDM